MNTFKTVFFTIVSVVLICAHVVYAQDVIVSHAISMRGEPKYPADFTHFEYVNPDAPKGGMLTLYAIGTYDSFHRYAQRGSSADGIAVLHDSLMTASEDEIEVYYGLIAEKVEYSSDYTWIIFHIKLSTNTGTSNSAANRNRLAVRRDLQAPSAERNF